MPKKNSLLDRLKQKYRCSLILTGRDYRIACRKLLYTRNVLNAGGICYFLDAGALLGLARDGDLIPWADGPCWHKGDIHSIKIRNRNFFLDAAALSWM